MSLSIDTQPVGDREVRLTLRGEIDYATAPDVRAAISESLSQRTPAVIHVDLAGVTMIDSTGIGTLVVAHRITNDLGVRLRVHNPNRFVIRLFEIVGVADLFGVAPMPTPAEHQPAGRE